MKKSFKIKYLQFLIAALLPLAAVAADGVTEGKRLSPDERKARVEQCRADPDQCRAEFIARREQWCKDNAERCQQIKTRIEQRRTQCQADPQQCQAERQARFEQYFKRVDSDGDGLLSRAEVEQAMPRMLHYFEAIDANKDGLISMQELSAALAARHERGRLRQDSTAL
ncbi:MAG: hypothetical protein FJY56_11290 [Betaproteobacteria bacterium]|nr:hypothetical protein [Betaproteobacteria bacterium]